MKACDTSFIYSTWLKSYRNSNFASQMSNDTYYDNHKRVIEKILSKPTTSIHVLCEQDDPEHIYGYCVTERLNNSIDLVHYCYIKYTYRNMGFAKMLLTSATPSFGTEELHVTHANKNYKQLQSKYNLIYNPYGLV